MATKDGIVLDGVKYIREDSVNNANEDGLDVVLVRTFRGSQYVGLLEKIDGDTVYLLTAFETDYCCSEEAMSLAVGRLTDTSNIHKTVLVSKLIVRDFSTIHYMSKSGYETAKSFQLINN